MYKVSSRFKIRSRIRLPADFLWARRIFGTKTDDEKVKAKRRLEYLIERGDDNHLYVKKWLKLPFIPKIQADPNFYSWRNNVRLKLPSWVKSRPR
jgi:hypothetical protein